jgi:hypothetical protein
MAIKDWMMSGNNVWFNRSTIGPDLSTEWVFIEKDTKGYRVWVHRYDDDLGLIRNASKSKAIKVATEYMRSH